MPSLANVNWSVFQSAVCRLGKLTTGEMVPVEGSNLAGVPDNAPTVSTHLSSPCSGILALCTYRWTS